MPIYIKYGDIKGDVSAPAAAASLDSDYKYVNVRRVSLTEEEEDAGAVADVTADDGSGAQAAFDAFLGIDGIEGETQRAAIRDRGDYIVDFTDSSLGASATGGETIHIESFSWGMAQTGAHLEPAGLSNPEASLSINFTKVEFSTPPMQPEAPLDGNDGSGDEVASESGAAATGKDLSVSDGSYVLGDASGTAVFAFDGFRGGVSVAVGDVGSAHVGGIQVLMGDGSVRFVRDGLDYVGLAAPEAAEPFDLFAATQGSALDPTEQVAFTFARIDFDL